MGTDYGKIVSDYVTYCSDQQGVEWKLGHEYALAALGKVANKTILDFGCGPATVSLVLNEQGARVIAVDANREVIEQARRRDPLGDYRHYRGLLANELVGCELDLIYASFSFCVIPDRELRYILRDMRQLLRTGGKLVVLEPNLEKALGIDYGTLHYHRKEGVCSGDFVHVTLGSGEAAIELYDDIYRTHADYRMLLEEAGFVVKKMDQARPNESWGTGWEVESKYPPFLLIVAT